MQWSDHAFVLETRPHGENAVIATVLTAQHGKQNGYVHGGRSRKLRGVLQKGNRVAVTWQARLNEHLGTLTLDLEDDLAGRHLLDGFALDALGAVTSLLNQTLEEGDPHLALYSASQVILESSDDKELFPQLYFRWELGVLDTAGFPLDLATCAVTGQSDDLVYISPKSGRAVSAGAGEAYADKLFPLPASLADPAKTPSVAEINDILHITGHFIDRHLLRPRNRTLPDARTRFVDRLKRMARIGIDQPA